MGAYNFLDLVPKGCDKDRLPYNLACFRHHDRYPQGYFVDRPEI
jgi:hypothetical protein